VSNARVRLSEDVKRARLFLVSYAPLWAMLALRALPAHVTLDRRGAPAWGSLLFGALAAWSLVDAWRLVGGARKLSAVRMEFVAVRDEGGAVSGYLATYLLPLLGVSPADVGDWAAYCVFLGIALVIFVRTDLALVNPTLYPFGWRVVSAAPAPAPGSAPSATQSRAVVVCRDPTALITGVDVVRLAGCWITKREHILDD